MEKSCPNWEDSNINSRTPSELLSSKVDAEYLREETASFLYPFTDLQQPTIEGHTGPVGNWVSRAEDSQGGHAILFSYIHFSHSVQIR